MEIGKVVATPQIKLDAGGAGASPWHLGDILHAKVIGRSAADGLQLEIGHTLVHAGSDLSLEKGTHLYLRVVGLGETPQLQILDEATSDTSILLQTLRQVLPRQGPLEPFLHILARFQHNVPAGMPAEIEQAARELLAQLPDLDAQGISAAGLKSAFRKSGLFLEANLAAAALHSDALPPSDFKASLIKFADALQSYVRMPEGGASLTETLISTRPDLPGAAQELLVDVAHNLDSALARVKLNQLHSLLHEGSVGAVYVMDVPVRIGEDVNLIQLTIEEDAISHSGTDESQRWSVSLSFTLKELGTLHARLTFLSSGLTTSLWAEEVHTLQLLETEIGNLQQRLTDAGLAVLHINCYAGSPPKPHRPPAGHPDLVDLHV